jgi:hypothetical protein
MFHRNTQWSIMYFSGGELIETRHLIDEDMTRVKDIAYKGSPPEADMIKLRRPNGKILIRTEKKHWTRG